MGASGTGLQEKSMQIMALTPPKSEGDMADAVKKIARRFENLVKP